MITLKPFRFYPGKYANFWLLSPEGDGLDDVQVYVPGDRDAPDAVWLSFAHDVLNHHRPALLSLAQSRLRAWAAPTEKEYKLTGVSFGDYPYGPALDPAEGLKLCFQTIGEDCEDVYGEYTVSFNRDLWPIGYAFTIA